MKDTPAPVAHTFEGLGIAPSIFEAITKLGFTHATPIQYQAIPHAIEGKDVIGVAQTGTGKTLAFGIPLIQHFINGGEGKALILLPTRELAMQVEETFIKIGRPLGIKTALLIGGQSMGPQLSALKRNPDVVIATPGRLNDHLEQGTIRLTGVSKIVLDEADRMLDMGFWPQIKNIISSLQKDRQTMLFSATLSREIMQLATQHMRTPVSIEVAPQGSTAERVTQEFFIVPKSDKARLLEKVLTKFTGSTIVFTRTKHGAKRLTHLVKSMGHNAAEIHGNRSLGQRKDALEGFKSGKYRVLVATDIAARGIDVRGIELVVNFDMPMQTADYVHRIGRTARAGAEGHAITFAMPDERRDMRDIERLIRQPLTVTPMPHDLPAHRSMPVMQEDEPRRYGSRQSSGGRSGGSSYGRSSSRPPQRERSYSSARPSYGGSSSRHSEPRRFQPTRLPQRPENRDRQGD